MIKGRSTSCIFLRNSLAHSHTRSRSVKAPEATAFVHSQPLAPSSGCQGPDTHFVLCHAAAGPHPALPGLWLRWDLSTTHVSIPRAIPVPGWSLCKARLSEPCSQLHSPDAAGTATPLPLAPTQGNWAVRAATREEPGLTSRSSTDTQNKHQAFAVPCTQAKLKPDYALRKVFHSTLSEKQAAGVTKVWLSDLGNPAGIPTDFLAHLSPQQCPCPGLTSRHRWDPRASSAPG